MIDLKKVVDDYVRYFGISSEEIDLLRSQLAEGSDVFDRRNFVGHVTASGLILHKGSLLLIFHKKLQRYLQPGGHFENDESMSACAEREVSEETGLSVSLYPWHIESGIPIHIDTHFIPENKSKKENAHYHHDFMYVFSLDGDQEILLQESEVSGYKWVPLTGLLEDHTFKKVKERMKSVNMR